MADIINLRQARKAKTRAEQEQSAGQNRIDFGRTKAAKALSRAETNLAKVTLDNKRRDKSENI